MNTLQADQKRAANIHVVCAKAGVSVPTIKRLCARGEFLPGFMIGGSRRWMLDEVEAYLSAGCPPLAEWSKSWPTPKERSAR